MIEEDDPIKQGHNHINNDEVYSEIYAWPIEAIKEQEQPQSFAPEQLKDDVKVAFSRSAVFPQPIPSMKIPSFTRK